MSVATESRRDAYTSVGMTPEVNPMLFQSTLPPEFWSNVYADPSGCWLWLGSQNGQGYGRWRGERVHRAVLASIGRPVPEGLVSDHICRTRSCVNFQHLRAVTRRINSVENSVGLTALNLLKTHCPKGHEYTPESTRIQIKADSVSRSCRECDAEHKRQYKRRNRDAINAGRREAWAARG